MHTTGCTVTRPEEHHDHMLQRSRSNCAPLTKQTPHRAHHNVTTLTTTPPKIPTATYARSLHHKLHNRDNHFNLITTTASSSPNASTSLPQIPQCFPHLTTAAATTASSVDAHYHPFGSRGTEDIAGACE